MASEEFISATAVVLHADALNGHKRNSTGLFQLILYLCDRLLDQLIWVTIHIVQRP
jgi:hypothetical protein